MSAYVVIGASIILYSSAFALSWPFDMAPDPNDPIGSGNRVMLIQLSSFMSSVLFIMGIIALRK